MAAHGVLLTPSFQNYSDDSVVGFRMTVVASAPANMSEKHPGL